MVTPDFIPQLIQTLTVVTSAGPERVEAESTLNTILASNPSATLLGLVQIGSEGPSEPLRILSFVLFRRFAFKAFLPSDLGNPLAKEVWDMITLASQTLIQEALLKCLVGADKRREYERSAICDVIAEVERAGMGRQTTWPELASILPQLFGSEALALREVTFKIYSECIWLLEAEPVTSVKAGLSAGLTDASTGVRLAALTTAVALICKAETKMIEQYASLIPTMLEILPPLAAQRSDERLSRALLSFIDLASTPKVPSRVFKAHLPAILAFCLSIITPSPSPTSPNYSPTPFEDEVRSPALELLLSIAETAPRMTKAYPDFARQLVPTLLNLMGEREDDPSWLENEGFGDDDDESLAVIGEGALDRLSQALGPVVFSPFMQHLPALLSSSQWQHRHAGLSAIASIAEGCIDNMMDQLKNLMKSILKAMKDSHPRVQYAAIYAVGQLCTDLGGYVQDEFGVKVLTALMQVTTGKEPRLQAYGAAGTVNFLNGADPETLMPILPAVFAQLGQLIQHGKNFVKENSMEALTLLARCMDQDFGPLYPSIMPSLINLLETATDPSLLALRAKTLDCAATIASAVDSSLFAPDAPKLLQVMHTIQVSITEEDEVTERYLLRAYAQLAEVVGAEAFAPYISDAFPRLMTAAQKKPDMNMGEDVEEQDDEEWETVEFGGELVAIRTAGLEDKAEAVENLVILTQALGASLGVAALEAVLQIAVTLLKFVFHVGVREGAAILVATCTVGLSKCETPHEHRAKMMDLVSDELTGSIASESDPTIISGLITSWSMAYINLPNCLSPLCRGRFLKAIESQLTTVVQREQERAAGQDEDEDDAIDWSEQQEEDSLIFEAVTGSLRNLLRAEGTALPIQPMLPFLSLINSTSTAPGHFALRLVTDLIEYMGEASLPLVQPYLERVLGSIIDSDAITRRTAAYAVGIAAESAPSVYADFAIAGVETLFKAVGPIDMDDEPVLAARDNAVSALSRIITNLGDRLQLDTILPKWVQCLPVIVDGDEMIPSSNLLLELISRGHPSVSPTSDISTHILKCLVSSLQSEVLPPQLHQPVAQAFKSYLASIPGGSKMEVPEEVLAKVEAILNY